MSKGRGVGFFEAGNFHPDFIALAGRRRSPAVVSFVDPKGIRNLAPTDPKIEFDGTIKEIEQRLGDPNVVLSRSSSRIRPRSAWSSSGESARSEMDELNILFQDEDRDTYIETMLTRARVL